MRADVSAAAALDVRPVEPAVAHGAGQGGDLRVAPAGALDEAVERLAQRVVARRRPRRRGLVEQREHDRQLLVAPLLGR